MTSTSIVGDMDQCPMMINDHDVVLYVVTSIVQSTQCGVPVGRRSVQRWGDIQVRYFYIYLLGRQWRAEV